MFTKRDHFDLIIIQSTRKSWDTPLGNTEQNKWKEKEIEYNGNLENEKTKSCHLKKDKLP